MTGDTTPQLRALFTWRSAIADSDLSPGERLVAFTLSLHMNERGGSAFPTVRTIARESGLSVRSVQGHLKSLNEKKWLLMVAESDGRRGREYEAAVPPQKLRPVESCTTPPQISTQPPADSADRTSHDLSKNSSASAKPPRARDELFDALCRVTNTDPGQLTKSGRGAMNKCVRELRELEATGVEVRLRSGMLQRRYPNIAITAPALVKHWATLGTARSLVSVPDITPEEQAEFDALMEEVHGG